MKLLAYLDRAEILHLRMELIITRAQDFPVGKVVQVDLLIRVMFLPLDMFHHTSVPPLILRLSRVLDIVHGSHSLTRHGLDRTVL